MDCPITVGDRFAVTVNGKRFECVAKSGSGVFKSATYDRYIGNLKFYSYDLELTCEPFLILNDGTNSVTVKSIDPTIGDNSVPRTITVERITETIHTIDPKFLPKERCIKSIEVQDASVMSVVIDKDSSDNAFALSKLYMRVTSPIASAAVSANILLSDAGGNRVWGYSSTVSSTSKKYTHRLWAVKKPYGYDVDIANIGSATYNLVDDSAVSEAAIAKVTLTTETAFAEGTIIELWGC